MGWVMQGWGGLCRVAVGWSCRGGGGSCRGGVCYVG